VPLILLSHPGNAVVKMHDHCKEYKEWKYIHLGVGPEKEAGAQSRLVEVDVEGNFLVTRPSGAQKIELVFDISFWRHTEFNEVNLVGHKSKRADTFKDGGGRDFVINPDGTVSPAHATEFVLGWLPALCLVRRGSPYSCVFDTKSLRDGARGAPLTLLSHPGQAIVKLHDAPGTHEDWHYIRLGVEEEKAAQERLVKVNVGSRLFAVPSNGPQPHDLVLDIAFGRYEQFNQVNLVGHKHGNRSRTYDNAHGRAFTINPDGTVSPARASKFVLGIPSPPRRAHRFIFQGRELNDPSVALADLGICSECAVEFEPGTFPIPEPAPVDEPDRLTVYVVIGGVKHPIDLPAEATVGLLFYRAWRLLLCAEDCNSDAPTPM